MSQTCGAQCCGNPSHGDTVEQAEAAHSTARVCKQVRHALPEHAQQVVLLAFNQLF